MASQAYRKVFHRRIAALLGSMKGDQLESCACYFGGGSAIVMMLDEYRESRDVDFLCASQDGYRRLREAVFERGLAGLFKRRPKTLREVRADQYGIRAVLLVDDAPIKFEIIREGRVSLAGKVDGELGVPVLTRADLVAQKLLANADRGLDTATRSRDYIDLVAMERKWGRLPDGARRKAYSAYGQRTIEAALRGSERLLADGSYRKACVHDLALDAWLAETLEQRRGRTLSSIGARRPVVTLARGTKRSGRTDP